MELAVGAAQWVAQIALDRYVDSKLDEWAVRSCLGDEVKSLMDYFQTSLAMLDALGHKPIPNDRFPPLLSELKFASSEADDLLDELDYYRLQEQITGRSSVQMEAVQSPSFFQLLKHHAGNLLSIQFARAVRFIDRLLLHNEIEPEPEQFCSMKAFDKDDISSRMKTTSARLKKAMRSVSTVIQLQQYVASSAEQPLKSINYRETSSLLTEPKVFGRDNEMKTILQLLLSPKGKEIKYNNFSVLPIVGIGGVGKTTLAQLLYNDPRIASSFELRAWACASDTLSTLDVRKLTIDIIASISEEGFFNLAILDNLDKLQTLLQRTIRNKKFLIVIDDVWVSSRWNVLTAPLSSGMSGSIVIVTTRDHTIAEDLGTMPPVTLTGLPINFFWEIFVQNSFAGSSLEENQNLVSIGQEIAAKLHGIPLAAKTVGRLLNKKLDEQHWFSILNSNLWNLKQGPDDIMPALMLSYQNLSVHVQRCFSYCSVFPKDHVFSKEELLYTWIAQGFIEIRPDDQTPEHVAEDYLNELLAFSFFQPKDGHYIMHDLLHDLAISVSKGEYHVMHHDFSTGIPRTARHLCVPTSNQTREKCRTYSLIEFGAELSNRQMEQALHNNLLELDKLRTLLFTDFSAFVWRANGYEDVTLKCENFTGVRVLASPYTKKGSQLGTLYNLIHLRYLDLSFSSIDQLPESICVLFHLQVLNVHGCGNLMHLPRDIVNLRNLRHLIDGPRRYLGIVPGIGKMTSLHELDEFYIENQLGRNITELNELQELRGELAIYNLENVESGEEACQAKLKEKKRLDKLQLSWNEHLLSSPPHVSVDVLESLCPPPFLQRLSIIGYGGTHCPTWLSDNGSLSCLKSLTLRGFSGWASFPALGHLPHLTKLELICLNSVRKAGRDFYGLSQEISFPCLKELLFENIPNWDKWEGMVQRRIFPCLEKLTICQCPRLKYVPVFQLQEGESSQSVSLPNRPEIRHVPTRSPLPFNLHYQTHEFLPELRIVTSLKQLTVLQSPGFVAACNKLIQDDHRRQSGSPLMLKVLFISCTSFLTLPICQKLTSLVSLTMANLEDGPDEVIALTGEQEQALLHLVCLKVLVFRNCRNLQFLPQKLHRMMGLKELHVVRCDRVQSLPDRGLPASLELLVIDRNSELDIRCQSDEQHKVAHVREVKYSS